MYASDPDDDWSRLAKRLRERRQEIIGHVIVGGLVIPEYERLCGQIAMLDEMITIIREVRRGDDLRPPPEREPLLSPEE